MPGERWPEKRARAVLYAGAAKHARDGATVDPDIVADTALAVRALLFTDDEVREETADAKAHRIGYSADCMQFATLETAPDGVALGLWIGPEQAEKARTELGAAPDPNPFRAHFGWVRVPLRPGGDAGRLASWVASARGHAAQKKATQASSTM